MSNKHKLSLIQVFPRVINDTKIVIGCFITGSNATNVCEALLKLTVWAFFCMSFVLELNCLSTLKRSELGGDFKIYTVTDLFNPKCMKWTNELTLSTCLLCFLKVVYCSSCWMVLNFFILRKFMTFVQWRMSALSQSLLEDGMCMFKLPLCKQINVRSIWVCLPNLSFIWAFWFDLGF